MKSPNFSKMEKFAENCKISQKFGVSRQILDKIGVQLRENLHSLKDIFNKLSYIFIFHEKILSGS